MTPAAWMKAVLIVRTPLAAHARAQALTLVTHNTREFVRAPGRTVENWVG